MQFIETSIVGVRSAVITLKRRTTPLRFMLFPMVHVGEQAFYDEVAVRAGRCGLIVAEGSPAGGHPVQSWMAGLRRDNLVDQINALDLESLGVPVQWEWTERPPRDTKEQVGRHVFDSAAAVAGRLLGRSGNPLNMSNLDEPEAHDARWERKEAGRFTRFLDKAIIEDRDQALVQALSKIHRERYTEDITVAVVWGAAHMPAVLDHLGETYRYYVTNAEWLIVANAPS